MCQHCPLEVVSIIFGCFSRLKFLSRRSNAKRFVVFAIVTVDVVVVVVVVVVDVAAVVVVVVVVVNDLLIVVAAVVVVAPAVVAAMIIVVAVVAAGVVVYRLEKDRTDEDSLVLMPLVKNTRPIQKPSWY